MTRVQNCTGLCSAQVVLPVFDNKLVICYNNSIVTKQESKMNTEYRKFVIQDSATQLGHAVAVYAVPLIAYWTMVA